jgi:hypothetical protein
MAIDSLTTDEFMDLSKADHEAAIALYEGEVSRLQAETNKVQGPGSSHVDMFDKMCSYLQLRKVHKARLEEMQEEEKDGATLQAAA